MTKRLQVILFNGWKSIEGPREYYPYRFIREIGNKYGILDIGFAEYSGGTVPNPSHKDLMELAQETFLQSHRRN
jgi:hypothetical protein